MESPWCFNLHFLYGKGYWTFFMYFLSHLYFLWKLFNWFAL
jgi:hypothetical protein